ncbi:endonuclease [Lewinellaceae bacterium SD302]|nr:endonuclease [Lewinellaceae bacterium SD302]
MPKLIFVRQYISLVILLFSGALSLVGQSFTLASWNISNLGKTKTGQEIWAMATIISLYDIVGIQEVVGKDPAGAKAVARIVDQLNRMGSSWDYRVSDPTRSTSGHISERYAYIWRKSKVTHLRSGLDGKLAATVNREPFWLEIRVKGFDRPIWLTNFHSRPHDQEPELEIAQLVSYPSRAGDQPLILLGDWNLDEDHAVWQPFYVLGYAPAVRNTPTTLKRKCKDGDYRNHSIDNLYYPANKLEMTGSGFTDFVNGDCENLPLLRHLSDHLPVWGEFSPLVQQP